MSERITTDPHKITSELEMIYTSIKSFNDVLTCCYNNHKHIFNVEIQDVMTLINNTMKELFFKMIQKSDNIFIQGLYNCKLHSCIKSICILIRDILTNQDDNVTYIEHDEGGNMSPADRYKHLSDVDCIQHIKLTSLKAIHKLLLLFIMGIDSDLNIRFAPNKYQDGDITVHKIINVIERINRTTFGLISTTDKIAVTLLEGFIETDKKCVNSTYISQYRNNNTTHECSNTITTKKKENNNLPAYVEFDTLGIILTTNMQKLLCEITQVCDKLDNVIEHLEMDLSERYEGSYVRFDFVFD